MAGANSGELIREFNRRASATGLRVDVLGDGDINAEIAIVGEFPGERECSLKQPFVGGSGQHLWNTLRRHGINRTQVWSTNVIKRGLVVGRDFEKTAVPKAELSHWEGLLEWELSQLPRLKYVLVLGNFALTALLGEHAITNWRGSVIPKDGRHYVVTFNPAHVMREPKWEVMFAFDIGKLMRVIKGEFKQYDITAHTNPSYREGCSWIDRMHEDRLPVSFDIEVIAGETACVGLANSNHEGMCISFRDQRRNTYSLAEEYDLRLRLSGLLTASSTRLVAQNGSFDASWLAFKDRFGAARVWFDTLLAHHTLYPSLPHSLGFLCSQYTDHPYYKDEKNEWREGGDINTFWEYNVKDCCITRKASERLLAELQAQKLDDFFFKHVMRLQPHLVRMCVLGVSVDTPLKEHITNALRTDLVGLEQEFYNAVQAATGDPTYRPSPRSPKQLAELFFGQLRLVGRGTSTNKENRKRMLAHPRTSDKARDVIIKLDKYAKEQKFFSTYADSSIDEDDHIRCEYKQYGTQSAPGRLSSSGTLWGTGMNLQNQPVRAKPMYVADKGCRFVYFDLAQAEARVVAQAWNVKGLQAIFADAAQGKDVHRSSASRIFKLPYDDIPKDDWTADGQPTKRYLGKRCVHGLNYRMQIQKLADVCNISYAQASDAFHAYHREFPEIKQAWDAIIDRVYKEKALYTCFGRRLIFLGRLPSRNASYETEDANILDSIIAFEPQSTIGDKVAITIADIETDPEWPTRDARVVLNIHDALIAQTRDDDELVHHCARIMKKHAESPIYIRGAPLSIPADLALSKAVSWRIINEGGVDEAVEYYDDAGGYHRWSSLVKFKLQGVT